MLFLDKLVVQNETSQVNPNGAGGHNVPTLFSDGYFSMKKGSGGPKFRDFS